ncbi:MAG: cystathionine beta-lyase [Candidatus Handelsmanbacteria bacterium RIFCSPLOWO2_12_FULL_64_10]|uniref:Cystathionine beta-lyase n=1 Tax=Handelsmanbacteria sp. (strain RIFCSPLOWO2_12_FULL_64_10) TaxID=1817868 RepID=A0A1F6D6F7_HANXR|nr:MAG: cystathionine beta-lyase [Candidatus Handelsmanbacteria bacterium RIFCSPLOWO2_12_FULL_64_10]
MLASFKDIQTQLIHAGELETRVDGAVCLPVFQSATFEYGWQTNYDDLKYIRLNNTLNHRVLHAKLAAIEKGETALVTGSGMAAITASLIAFLKAGDHLLAQGCLYGGTHSFITQDLPGLGVAFDFIDGNDPDSWGRLLRPETRAIYVETMTNPLLEVPDLRAVVRFAGAHDLVSMIDNTFASPVNFRPLEHGFDLSIHSCTKYLNGHSDIVAGCVIGREARIVRIVHKLNHLGGSLDPHACFLLHRGMKTLALRVRQQNENALRLSRFLSAHPAVERVNYPGLEAHPQHARARELFEGCGGVLSFEMRGGVREADTLISRLRLPICAPSLGGVESLITRPATTSHSGLSPEERARLHISDKLVRAAVGIEAPDDLCADFEQALAGM